METQLRRRIESLIAISNHSIRSIEHRTFRRLLYRNRNQHRHGFYFRKLDHVRRLVIRIDGHIAWGSLQYSLGDSDPGKSQKNANIPLSVSSLTVSDLDGVEKQLDKLVTTVIIEAARRVMTDLVCREHFLPFAISVLASLARLFVVERKVLSEVRGVRTEMNLLFATECNTGPPQDIVTPSAQAANEDIGLEMSVRNEPKPEVPVKTRHAETLANRVGASKHGNTVEPSGGNNVHLPTAIRAEAREPSLYQVVAKHVDTTKFSVEFRNRISVSLPKVLGNAHQKHDGKSSLSARTLAKTATAANDEGTVLDRAPQSFERRVVGSDLNAGNQRPHLPDDENKILIARASAHNSDSDDIDDIFDALEDT